MTDPQTCYRHPDRLTYLSCSECGRPICEECMSYAPVGIRCPDHATVGAPRRGADRSLRQARRSVAGLDAPATVALIVLNVVVYLVTVAQGGGLSRPGGQVFTDGALVGAAIEVNGDWYRLVTAMFLHASLIHLMFNMMALWWLGSIVEQAIGTGWFLGVYFVSGIAGSAGALLLTDPLAITVGASGAIYGIMGALLVLEYQSTGKLGGPALTLIVINLALTFAIPNISIGGHLGGLIGGVAATFALVQARKLRSRAVGAGLLALVLVVSFAVAAYRVETMNAFG